MWARLLALDRRWVFLAMGSRWRPRTFSHWTLPLRSVSPETRKVFDIIEHSHPETCCCCRMTTGPPRCRSCTRWRWR